MKLDNFSTIPNPRIGATCGQFAQRLPLFAVLIVLASMASIHAHAQAAASPQAAAPASATPSAPAPVLDKSYRIGSGDVLEINVWKEPEASVTSITVRPDGVISMPLIKEVHAVGKTPSELEEIIEEKLGKLIRDADVTVVVRETRSEKVYVIGAVRKEGPINLQARLRVLEVIAEAGGLTDYAKRNKIYILRQGEKGQVRIPFDYTSVIRGLRTEQNIIIERGDTIVVP